MTCKYCSNITVCVICGKGYAEAIKQPNDDELVDAAQAYRDAQDALDNREYAGINAEPYEVLMRRRNAARDDLDTVLARPTPAAAAEPVMQPTGWQWRRLGETEWRTGGMPANEPGMNYEMRGTFNAGPASPEAAGVPPGMVLVPREPTLAMMSALSGESNPALMDGFRADYRAMLAASGAPAGAPTEEEQQPDSGDVHPAAGDAERAFASPLPSLSQTDRSAPPQWLPIETAPKTGEHILLGFAGSHSGEGFWMGEPERNYWRKTGWFECDDDVLCEHPSQPSHWMHLIAPPLADAGGVEVPRG